MDVIVSVPEFTYFHSKDSKQRRDVAQTKQNSSFNPHTNKDELQLRYLFGTGSGKQ